jgi:putative transposase
VIVEVPAAQEPALPLNRVLAADANYECPCACGCLTRERRYPTDLTDEQWAVLEPLLPVMLCTTVPGGRPERHSRRTMVNAVFYLVDNGIKWRAMPADFPPWRTVWGMHARWKEDGVLARIVDGLRTVIRVAAGRGAEPSAAIVDAQSVHESAEGVVPAATSGYDSHKKVNGRKRHLLADTLGLLICVVVTAACAEDRAGAAMLLKRARARGRRLALIWADSAYRGDWRYWCRRDLGVTVEVVPQPRDQKGFQVLPRRWVVERTHAWITRRRRCARDYERLPAHHAAMVEWAAIIQMTRRAAKTTKTAPA